MVDIDRVQIIYRLFTDYYRLFKYGFRIQLYGAIDG